MQDRPTAAELLETIADLLEGDLLAATQGPLRHPVRVAGNLCRILEREARLGPSQEHREQQLLRELLQRADGEPTELNAALDQALAAGDDATLEPRALPVLVEIVRGKLAIAKPGHDAYRGEPADDDVPGAGTR